MPESAIVNPPATKIIDDHSNNIKPDAAVASFESEVFGKNAPAPEPPTPPAQNNQPTTPAQQNNPPAQPNNQQDANKPASNLGDFNKILAGDTILGPQLKAVEKDKDGKPIVQQDSNPQQNQQNDNNRARNLEGFGEQEAKWLQRMPYEAYEHISKELREARQTKKEFATKEQTYNQTITDLQKGKVQIPANYYENPNAAFLLPEVSQIQENIRTVQTIEQHWREQLNIIEAGLIDKTKAEIKGEEYKGSWTTLARDKDGDIVIGEDAPITSAAKVQVMQELAKATQAGHILSQNLMATVNGFKEKHSSLVTNIRQAESKYMPIFDDEKAEEYKIYQAVKPKLAELGITEQNPAFQMLAKSTALNMILRDMVLSQHNNANRQTAIAQDVRQAGPNMNSIPGNGGSQGGPAPVSLNDYNKMLNGGR